MSPFWFGFGVALIGAGFGFPLGAWWFSHRTRPPAVRSIVQIGGNPIIVGEQHG